MIKRIKHWLTRRHIERNKQLILNPEYVSATSIADFNNPSIRFRNRERK